MRVRTFIHHDGAIGDVLLSLPSLRAIREDSGPVHLAARADVAALLRDSGCVDETSSPGSGRYASLYSGRPDTRLRSFLGQFERAVVFSARADSPVAVSLKSLVLRTGIVMTVPRADERTHVSVFRVRQLGRIGESDSAVLKISGLVRGRAAGLLSKAGYEHGNPLVTIHPGSGGAAKCWPLERYLDLVERLQIDCESFVLILAGPAESAALKERVAQFALGRERTALVAGEDLGTIAALLELSDAYIGNDSGISHLAASVGCRTTVPFGPTDPSLWMPVGAAVRVVTARTGEPLSSITVEEVLSAVHGIQDRLARA